MDHLTPEDRQKLLDQLKRHEGTERNAAGEHIAYRCTAGALTIGYGHNLDANPVPGINAASTLNDSQAGRLLMADLKKFVVDLDAALPWARALAPARYAVLLNMAYNLGINSLIKFRPTLEHIRLGEYAAASKRMMGTLWSRQVGDGPGKKWDRAEELAHQMLTGEW